MSRLGRLRVVAPLLPLLFVGACSAGPEAGPVDPEPPSPFADCAVLAGPPSGAGRPAGADPSSSEAGRPAGADPSSGAGSAGGATPTGAVGDLATRRVPAIGLPCFTGGGSVSLDALRGPAVINLWASWCQPCRKELPALQRLADRAAGRVHVVGVDTRDRRESARSLAVDLGLSFPNLVDPDESLRTELGRAALPITLLVDGQGRIRHLHDSGALDDATLAGLVRRHLGVATGL